MGVFDEERNGLFITVYLATKLTSTVTAVCGRKVLKERSSMDASGKQ